MPNGIVFDGASVWVANSGDNTATKLRVTEGKNLGTFAVGAFRSTVWLLKANIWVTKGGSNTVSKL